MIDPKEQARRRRALRFEIDLWLRVMRRTSMQRILAQIAEAEKNL